MQENAELRYALGCNTKGDNREGFAEALGAARWSDVVVLCLGEDDDLERRECFPFFHRTTTDAGRTGKRTKKVGKPVVLILVNGRPLELNRLEPVSDAILEIWQPGVRRTADGGDIVRTY